METSRFIHWNRSPQPTFETFNAFLRNRLSSKEWKILLDENASTWILEPASCECKQQHDGSEFRINWFPTYIVIFVKSKDKHSSETSVFADTLANDCKTHFGIRIRRCCTSSAT